MTTDEYVNQSDGLIYCAKCNTSKQYRLPQPVFGFELMPRLCDCEAKRKAEEDVEHKKREDFERVRRLKANGIQDKVLLNSTFDCDNGKCPQMAKAKRYVGAWEDMYKHGIGLFLWGDVGTGKSFFAACIANALLEQFVPVLMTNFSMIINTMSTSFSEDKNAFIKSLDRYKLLIIDDLGVERGTEYALEQVYAVIDARCKSEKPLIITSNLSLSDMKSCEDVAYKRIYSRVLGACVPIQFNGEDMRKNKAEQKLNRLKEIL